MTVPFLDLKSPYLELRNEMDEAYRRVMESGWYIMGEEVEAFESEFATYCGAKYCIGVGNGLDALHLIVRAYVIGPGDEVFSPLKSPSHTLTRQVARCRIHPQTRSRGAPGWRFTGLLSP